MLRLKLINKKNGVEIRACLIQNGQIELWEMEDEGTMKFLDMYEDLYKLSRDWGTKL